MGQGCGGDGGGGFGGEADHLLAVGREDLGVGAPGLEGGAVVNGRAVDADGDGTAAAECVEDGAFYFYGEAGLGVVEGGYGGADGVVARGVGEGGVLGGAGFEGEGGLAGGGAELVDGEAVVDLGGEGEAVEAGGGEDEGVALAFG